MMGKDVVITVKIDSNLKNNAEVVFKDLALLT